MNNEKVKVSVIVPVYNNEEYLQECIESIINQTFRYIQIILVDDGSTDNSGKICDEYSKKDNRIIVIHSENKGVSNARNIGIDRSIGDYIIFCDSDDWIEKDYIEILYKNITEKNVDAVYSGVYREFYKDNNLQKNEVAGVSNNLQINKSDLGKYLKYILQTMEGPFLASWAKIYKSEVIKKYNLYFDLNMIFHEDYDFNLRFLKYAKSLYFIKDIKYHFRAIIGNGGIKKRKKYDVIYEISKYHKEINELLKMLDENKELKEYIETSFIEYYKLVFLKLIMSEKQISKKYRNEILKKLSRDKEFCDFIYFNKNRIRLYKYIKILIDKRLYSLAYFIIKRRIH